LSPKPGAGPARRDPRCARYRTPDGDRCDRPRACLATASVHAVLAVTDDARFAERRADALAERGFGDEAIRDDLERQGVPPELRDQAVAALPDESGRARKVVARRGPGPKTARYLSAKGFGEDAVEAALAGSIAADT